MPLKKIDREVWLREMSKHFRNVDWNIPDSVLDFTPEIYITCPILLYALYHDIRVPTKLSGMMYIGSLIPIDIDPVYILGIQLSLSTNIIPADESFINIFKDKVALWHENWYYDITNEKLFVAPKTMKAIENKNIIIKKDDVVKEEDIEFMIYHYMMKFEEKHNQHSQYVRKD